MAVTVNRKVYPLHTPLSHTTHVGESTSRHRPPGSMPSTKATGKERAGARQDSEPAPYSHHLSTVLINLCVRHSYFIMWRAHVQVRRQRRRSRRRRARQSRLSRVRRKAHASRPARPWPGASGMAKSPGGTEHTFIANSGITPNGASDEVKAVLRGALHHSGQPGCSETMPAMVSDSPIAMRK